MTSARSAKPINSQLWWSDVRFTGAARKPPSLPICHTSTPGMSAKSRMRKRDWHPLRNRNRYRRCSTVWNGHVLPFTMIMLPKNSGFQIGEKLPSMSSSVSSPPCSPTFGMNGPTIPSKNSRVFG